MGYLLRQELYERITATIQNGMIQKLFLILSYSLLSRMVFETNLGGTRVYVCSVCRLAYKDEVTAGECEAFCKEFNACSLKIARKALGSV